MPRRARVVSETGVYHAMVRGINRQDIFIDKDDRLMFLEKLSSIKEHFAFTLYAYCLMSNHVHLLLREEEEPIGKTMQRLGSSYVYWYNKKYERIGHLFQGRFRSEPITDEAHLLRAIRYIHQNPLKARMVATCKSYPWSSYNAYLCPRRNKNGLTDTKLVLQIFGSVSEFVKFHNEPCGDDLLDVDDITKATDQQAEKLVKEILLGLSFGELRALPRNQRNLLLQKMKDLPGVSLRQIARITGLSKSVVHRA